MGASTRRKAQSWPYPRYRDFEEHLRQAAERWFREKGYPLNPRYPYILDRQDHWKLNIIVPDVATYIAEERARRETQKVGFPLHKYVHHGLSSQAMLFNLVGPLILCHDLDPLRRAIQAQGISWPDGTTTASFEYENRTVFNENQGQPTSVDLVIGDQTSTPAIFIEAKLVEREFGGCSVFANGDCDGRNPVGNLDQCYLHFIGRRYWELLECHGFLEGPVGTERLCPLAIHYQFFRELLFALELGGVFVLLYDARNPTFFVGGPNRVRGLAPLLLEFVPAKYRCRVGAVTIQQILAELHGSDQPKWVSEFEKKYGLVR